MTLIPLIASLNCLPLTGLSVITSWPVEHSTALSKRNVEYAQTFFYRAWPGTRCDSAFRKIVLERSGTLKIINILKQGF